MLLDNNARVGAFGPSSELNIPGKTVSVKTGTTNDLKDNWTFGFTPDYLVATWVGNNDSTPMSYVASGITGASPIWNDIMKVVLKGIPDHFPTQPDGVVSQAVCNINGLLPTPESPCETRTEYFIENHLPPTNISSRKQIWIRRDTKTPLQPGENVIDLDLEEHTVLSDPFFQDYCLDCNYPQETKANPNNPSEQIPTGKIQYPTVNINYDIFRVSPPKPDLWTKNNQNQTTN
jgi:membrane carboxypeptidase/penicillin-binding protein PbpC